MDYDTFSKNIRLFVAYKNETAEPIWDWKHSYIQYLEESFEKLIQALSLYPKK